MRKGDREREWEDKWKGIEELIMTISLVDFYSLSFFLWNTIPLQNPVSLWCYLKVSCLFFPCLVEQFLFFFSQTFKAQLSWRVPILIGDSSLSSISHYYYYYILHFISFITFKYFVCSFGIFEKIWIKLIELLWLSAVRNNFGIDPSFQWSEVYE